jgi:hypothetical protein
MSDTYGAGLVDELDDEDRAMMGGGEEAPAEETPAPEPVAEAPAAEAAPAEAAPAGEEEDNDGEEVTEVNGGRFIRHGAFHRQRKIAQELKAANAELNNRIAQEAAERARINERLAILMEATQPQAQPQQHGEQPQVPNPEEDPFAYMRYLESRLNELGQTTEQVVGRTQAEDTYTNARTAFMQDAGRYAQQQPDFMDAYNHLMQSRNRELNMIGRTDPRERQQIIAQEELMIVTEAFRQGRSPAELMYALAADRGYRKAEEAAPVVQAPAAAPKTAVEQVKAVVAAQAASKSLSSASGGGSTPVTAESLASMPEAEFEKLYASMSRDQRRAYFGG